MNSRVLIRGLRRFEDLRERLRTIVIRIRKVD